MNRPIDYVYILPINNRVIGLLVAALIPDKTAMYVSNAFV